MAKLTGVVDRVPPKRSESEATYELLEQILQALAVNPGKAIKIECENRKEAIAVSTRLRRRTRIDRRGLTVSIRDNDVYVQEIDNG